MTSTTGLHLPEFEHLDSRKKTSSDYVAKDGMAASLQFVINNKPHLPSSRKHKKIVRTHVMRNYHTHQKKSKVPVQRGILRKIAPHAQVQLDSSASPPNTNDGSKESTQASSSTPPWGSPFEELLDASSIGSESEMCLTPNSSHLSRDNSLGASPPSFPEPVSVSTGDRGELDSPSLPVTPHLEEFDRWAYDTTTPYVLFQDEGAPMLCLSARTWPFPKPIGAEKPKFSIFMPSRIIPIPNFKLPRGWTIKWINHRLNAVSTGVNDSTIGSILLLVNFELMRGNVMETLYHMDGVQMIVNLRGGLSSVNDRNVLTRILIIDLLVAVLSTSQPRFSQPSLMPPNFLGTTFYKIADSPLTTRRTMKVALLKSPFCEKAIQSLQYVQTLTMLVISGIDSGLPTLPIQEPERITGQKSLTLLEIIQHTSDIYARALQTPPIPFSSRVNWDSIRAICRAVESPANDSVWDQFPGIFTWILMVGCAAAEEGSTEYNYFMCLLIKVALGAGYGWLKALREAVSTFVVVRARAEKG
ncbi:hypothetical protein G7Y89_g12055 [Cudoniella acicularis]|uniref:Tachykinin family protein n=1 Tax=Cudoniella acicularis TaxID=354080 RepID=A0A8H4RCK0_9HELO|nr:hypothetical protein G7Y89_g12055 [Cudoniella acicularis]